jgi:hypothetical protein
MDALVLVFALVPDLLWHGTSASSLVGTMGIGLALILGGSVWAIYRDARQSGVAEAVGARISRAAG